MQGGDGAEGVDKVIAGAIWGDFELENGVSWDVGVGMDDLESGDVGLGGCVG